MVNEFELNGLLQYVELKVEYYTHFQIFLFHPHPLEQ